MDVVGIGDDNTAVSWRDYQETAAQFFRRLHLSAEVEVEVRGIRGTHVVDVCVTGTLYGIPLRWLVECKAWKTNVSKEKVMALQAIVLDVGADRGFLLSEKGFQSGAMQAARSSNVTLSSISDLETSTHASLVDYTYMRLMHRQREINGRLWTLHKKAGDEYMSHFTRPMGSIFLVDIALTDGLQGKFPNIYGEFDGKPLIAPDWDELITGVTKLLDDAETYAKKHESPST